MLSYDRIQVQRIILHTLDHKNATAPQLTSLESPATADAQDFLKRHIVNNSDHRYARSGVFNEDNEEGSLSFRGVCDELLSSPDKFIPQSQVIAQRLFDAMSTNKNISPCVLVIATFTDGDASRTPWLALLKVDPEDGYIVRPEVLQGGVRGVLQHIPNILTTGELQKCAFILPQAARTKRRHLIVLDQQTARRGAVNMVATFFVSTFLQCGVDLNKKEKTNAFVLGSYEYGGKKRDEWPEEQRERLYTAVQQALQGKRINIELVAQNAIEQEEEQEKYIEFIRNKMRAGELGGLVFDTDPDIRNEHEYIVIEGDNDLKIRIRADAVGPRKTLTFEKDKATNKHIIKITTAQWKTERVRGRK